MLCWCYLCAYSYQRYLNVYLISWHFYFLFLFLFSILPAGSSTWEVLPGFTLFSFFTCQLIHVGSLARFLFLFSLIFSFLFIYLYSATTTSIHFLYSIWILSGFYLLLLLLLFLCAAGYDIINPCALT